MRLFIRDHIPLICFSIIQSFIMLLVYWFDGYDRLPTAFYAIFLGLCLLLVYLVYRYVSHRDMYQRLSHPQEVVSNIDNVSTAPFPKAFNEVLTTQYRYHHQQLKSWERKQQDHLTFMNQWVHQMKTPLSVIELITQDADDTRFESIGEETDRLRQGLEMVLYMARLETFAQDFHVDKVELRELVNEVIQDNKRSFIRSYVYPEIMVDVGFVVETDAKWLRFILQQVLSNAIKYSAGSREKVTVSAFTEERAVILEIKDHGIGIPKSDLSRVFRPFFTGENGRAYKESTGMGLYLVQEVIDRLNHEIRLASEAGVGTTVQIVFPYALN
ncbi:sensor histidine kinase [Paenibacillus sp. ACRRX]|uniref:sensor histidine kinase n=1 Tax=Paenibacillus sp. ACRRX TaxID=2918206 RepID=UPI001EF58BFA|nr:sensor histidine kinase [Paenibacillus sp. ACRRX]MCG7409620.1 sensor histidine kinase [Paenibacillus sp. ACRRX]